MGCGAPRHGPLLEQLLSCDYGDTFGTASESDRSVGLVGAPVVVIDGDVAIVVAPLTNSGSGSVGAVAALLIRASTTGTVRPWFVASLTQDQMLDHAFQRRVQHESFPIDADLDIIAAHGPLDVRAASIDWDDDSVILRRSDTGAVTVADARAEAATWPRKSWHWLADDAHTFTGLYLRGCHPELAREFPAEGAPIDDDIDLCSGTGWCREGPLQSHFCHYRGVRSRNHVSTVR